MNYITETQGKSSKPLVRKSPALIIGLALLMAGTTVYTLRQFSASQPKPVPEMVIPKIKTVTALGRLEPSGEIIQISVSSSSEGNRIEELLIKEGEQVKKGQVIAILDSRDRLEAALRQAEARVTVAQANLAKVKAGAKTGEIEAQKAAIARIQAERDNNIAAQTAMVSRIKAELRNAQLEYQRYQKLYDEGAISASQRDNKELILATAKEQLAEAKANLTRIRLAQQQQIAEAKATLNKIAEIRPVDVEVAAAEVREAQAAVATAQAERDRAYIKSPQAGTVIKILTRPGEVVSSNEGIVRIGQVNQMYAVAEVYESDIGKVKIGQQVTITSSAIAGELTGTVERIGLEVKRQEVVNTDPTANIDAKVVEVKVKLDQQSSQKVTGLTNLLVNVKINL
ncbi:MAG: ABC exporter membrane fusion protein [Xenococcaceae cyanobacterium MO_234.B1]|nr:ABC exporter membrane fusion protein [Xenococcaceae cyanobacterium MO_234.B1]